MTKILVFSMVGLIAIGTLGWSLGQQQRRTQASPTDASAPDAHLPVTTMTTARTRIDATKLAGWMERRDKSCLIIDLRSAEQYNNGHLWRAINRDHRALVGLQGLRRLPRHRSIVLYGNDPELAAAAAEALRVAGLTSFYLPMNEHAWQLLSAIGPAGREATQLAGAPASQVPDNGPSNDRSNSYHPAHQTDTAQPGQPPRSVADARREALTQLGFLSAD